MPSDEDPPIQNEDKHSEQTATRMGFKHALIFPLLILFYLPAEIFGYVTNEWIQHTIISQQFGNTGTNYTTLHKSTTDACEDKNRTDSTSKDYKHAEKQIAQWFLYNKLSLIIPLIITNIVLQSYSDTYGRKFVFILSMVGVFVKNILVTVTIYFNLHVIFVTIAISLEGLTGGSTAITSMSFAYMADIKQDKRDRILGIVVIEAMFLLAGLCPGFIAGYMVQSILGYTFSAIACASAVIFSLVIVIFFLPETLPPEKRVSRKSIFRTVKRSFEFYTSRDFKGQRLYYLLLLLVFTVSCLAGNNRGGIETLYFLNQPFCWDPISYGYFTLIRQSSKTVFGTVTLRPLQKCFSNEVILIFTAVSSLASYVLEGLASATLTVYASSVADSLAFLNGPIIRGLMSTMTTADKQGSLFASLSVISLLSSLVADFSTTVVYQATASIDNGFVFLIMAAFTGLKVILLFVYMCKKSADKIPEEGT